MPCDRQATPGRHPAPRTGGASALGAPNAREMARAPARTAGPTRLAIHPAGRDDHRDRSDHLVPVASDRCGHRYERLRHVRGARSTMPSRRMSASRRRNAVRSTGRAPVRAPAAGASICSWKSRSAWASSTSPTPVECSGSRPPTRYSTVIADRPESRSTRTASVPSRTASRTCWPVATDRSPITGIAASRSPWLRGAREANLPQPQTDHVGAPAAFQRTLRDQLPGQPQRGADRHARAAGEFAQRQDAVRGSNPDSRPNARSITGSPARGRSQVPTPADPPSASPASGHQ